MSVGCFVIVAVEVRVCENVSVSVASFVSDGVRITVSESVFESEDVSDFD